MGLWDLKKIYTPEEERERRENIFELFTGIPASQMITRPPRHKPTVRVKLKGASASAFIEDKVKADIIAKLLTGNI
jgi:hypothetical protein